MRVKCRGSFTVEAVFLYPIIVALIAFMLSISINWYQSIRETAADTAELTELDTMENFLTGTSVDSFIETVTDR